MENFNQEIDQNRKLLDSNPDDFIANVNMGNLYYQHAEEKLSEADKIASQNEEDGKSLLATGKELLENSMPYYEKANEVKPGQQEVVQKLQRVYSQLNLAHKVKGINERM
jgi:hypothetical protein